MIILLPQDNWSSCYLKIIILLPQDSFLLPQDTILLPQLIIYFEEQDNFDKNRDNKF